MDGLLIFSPILLVIVIFFITRKITKALFFSSIAASLILTNFSVLGSLHLLFEKFLDATQVQNLVSGHFWASSRLFILLFIIGINLFISLIHKSGIFYGYYNFFHKKINDKRAAEASSIFLGILLFIDDYLSVMTNSRVSTMLCQKFKIPKLKISFLISCMAAPLCTLIPISSWSAEILSIISGALDVLKVKVIEPYALLVLSIPYIFFSLFFFLAAWLVIIFRFSFGKIYQEELLEAQKDYSTEKMPDHVWNFKLIHFLGPIMLLVILILGNMLWFGGFFAGKDFLFALKSNPCSEKSLFLGTAEALCIIISVLLYSKVLRIRDLWHSIAEGFSESKDILILLSLSNIFGRLIGELKIGTVLAGVLLPILPVSFLAAAVFVITFLVALLLGSSWASMTILLPMCIPLAVDISKTGHSLFPLLYTVVGAVLSGAVFGSSLSPASDLSLMNSKGCKISHFDFLKTQVECLLPVGFSAFISFVLIGQLANVKYGFLISFGAGIFCLFLLYALLSSLARKNCC